MATDLFKQINNAVLDLQAADLQSYARPLKTLAQLLRHSDLEAANSALTEGLDLDAFLSESSKSQGGMIGTATLAWPESDEQRLGLALLLIQRLAENPDYMMDFSHTYFYSGSKIMAGVHAVTRQMIIPFVRDYKDYVMNQGNLRPKLMPVVSNKVFIVHGREEGPREAIARFLARLGFEPIILHEQANQGRTVIEKVEAHSDVGFAVIILTPDDMGNLKGEEPQPRARQNVLLELGYFIGKLMRNRVCTFKVGELEIPSDWRGVVDEPYDAGGAWKQTLARELAAAGYEIDWNKVMRP